jgi:AcrR family transcriptional regulator
MENTKKRIIEHAAALFAQKGCKAVTIDDIATSIGMSKRTIYQIFDTKDVLVQACLTYFFEQQDTMVKTILKSSTNIIDAMFQQSQCNSELLHDGKYDFFQEIRKYYPEIYTTIVVKYKEKILESSVKLLKKGQHDGVIRKEVDANMMAILMHEMNTIIFTGTTFSGYNVDKKKLVTAFSINLSRGMATEKGMKIIDNHLEKHKKIYK